MSGTNWGRSVGQTGPLPGTNWGPSLGQTGLFLLNSTVKSPFCPARPWDGWGFVPGTIVPQGPSQNCLCVSCLLVFFSPQHNSAFLPEKTFGVGQARKKSTKINFLGPETARWGGGLPRRGVVAENFVPALESLSSLGFEERNLGCPGIFAGMSRTPGGVQKVCAKKLRARFSFPSRGLLLLRISLPGTELKSAALAQGALERAQEVFVQAPKKAHKLGRTRRGSYSPKRRVSAFYVPSRQPLLRTPSKNPS